MNRRGFLAGLAAVLAAPAVVRAEGLMRVVSLTPIADRIERAMRAGKSYWADEGLLLPERGLVLPLQDLLVDGLRARWPVGMKEPAITVPHTVEYSFFMHNCYIELGDYNGGSVGVFADV